MAPHKLQRLFRELDIRVRAWYEQHVKLAGHHDCVGGRGGNLDGDVGGEGDVSAAGREPDVVDCARYAEHDERRGEVCG